MRRQSLRAMYAGNFELRVSGKIKLVIYEILMTCRRKTEETCIGSSAKGDDLFRTGDAGHEGVYQSVYCRGSSIGSYIRVRHNLLLNLKLHTSIDDREPPLSHL